MTPERMAAVVAWWVRLYTRELPPAVAQRRIDEIDADLHDHIAHERARGTGERRIAFSILSRMVRGIAADASWRGQTIARPSTTKEVMKVSKTASRPAVRVALATAAILLLILVLMQVSDGVDWGVFDFVFAAVFLGGTGLLLELAVRKAGSLVYLVAASAIGVAAIAYGEADDAPGLMLFGCLLILAAVVLGVRTAWRST